MSSGLRIGYARVSLDKQDIESNRQELLALDVPEDRIYLDHGYSGANRARPALELSLAAVRAGDTLVTPKLDRLGRSLPDLRDIADTLFYQRQVRLQIGQMVYDPTDPMSKAFFNLLGLFAEFELDLIRMRTREGMAVARSRGRLKGKQPKLKPKQEAHLVAMRGTGEHSDGELAEMFGVSRSTVQRAAERARRAAASGVPVVAPRVEGPA